LCDQPSTRRHSTYCRRLADLPWQGRTVVLQPDYDAVHLRALAKASDDAEQTRRLLALALIYDGKSRGEAVAHGAVGLQTVRDWVLAFNAEGPDGLVNAKAPGRPALLSDDDRQALRAAVEAGPIPAVHGVVRWRLLDLMRWLHDEFAISLSKQTLRI
jgi:transposase